MSELNGDGGTDELANALRTATSRLEVIDQSNQNLKARFEAEDWSGLDKINTASAVIQTTRERLMKIADDIGVGGQIVRDARRRAQRAGNLESITGHAR